MDSLMYGRQMDCDDWQPAVESATVLNDRYYQVVAAVNRLRSAGIELAEPIKICEWNGAAQHGCFVQIDPTTCALHVGRGNYITVDIQRDLNGVTPREACSCILSRSGDVRETDCHRSYGAC